MVGNRRGRETPDEIIIQKIHELRSEHRFEIASRFDAFFLFALSKIEQMIKYFADNKNTKLSIKWKNLRILFYSIWNRYIIYIRWFYGRWRRRFSYDETSIDRLFFFFFLFTYCMVLFKLCWICYNAYVISDRVTETFTKTTLIEPTTRNMLGSVNQETFLSS